MLETEVKILETISREHFDALAIHPMQSYAWGEAKERTGVRVVRVGEYTRGVLTAVFQMTVHRVPNTKLSIGYLPRSAVPSAAVVSFVRTWARQEKIVFIKWEPYVYAKDGDEAMAALSHMHRSHHPLFTRWNQEIDLTPSEDELLKRAHEKTRYSIRLATRKGVEVREMNSEEGFKIFCDLYFATCKRQNYHGHTRKYHEIIWDILGKAGIARIFVAWYEGRPLAAYEIFVWHDKAYYTYGGTGDTDRNIPAAQLLMWTTMCAAKKAGAHIYDMWGSLAPDFEKSSHAWSGFTYFKRGFGTRFVEMVESHDQVMRPVLYALYSLVYQVRKFFFEKGVL